MRTNNNMRNVDKIHWDRIADSPHITGRKLPNGRKGVGATHGESRFGTYDLSGPQGVWSEMFDAVFFTPFGGGPVERLGGRLTPDEAYWACVRHNQKVVSEDAA
jgi:hypothetical protein